MESKICSKCKITKLLTEFNKNKLKKDGHHNQCRICIKQYFTDNAELLNKKKKQYRQKNSKKIKQDRKKYYQLNIDKERQNYKKYCQSELGKLVKKSCEHKRRILLKNNTPIGKNWNPQDIISKLKLQKYKCIYCQKSIKDYHEVDHIIPVSKDGSNEPSNIQLLCKKCNLSKSNKLTYEFANNYGKLF